MSSIYNGGTGSDTCRELALCQRQPKNDQLTACRAVVSIQLPPTLWTVLCAFGHMTGTAEKLALASLGYQIIPRSRPVRAKLEALSSRIDVIELKALCRTATDTATSKQLDQLSTATMLVGLDVDPKVLGSPGHLLPLAQRLWCPEPGVNQDLGSASLVRLRGGCDSFGVSRTSWR